MSFAFATFGGIGLAGQSVPPDDDIVHDALSAHDSGQNCRAHHILSPLVRRYPDGIFPADKLFLEHHYAEAFREDAEVIRNSHDFSQESDQAKLVEIAERASAKQYVLEPVRAFKASAATDLDALVIGEVAWASAHKSDAEEIWLQGFGSHGVPGGSSPYVGASLSVVVMWDRHFLKEHCKSNERDKKRA